MTSIVGILCTDGVVIGSDSSATFGPAPGMPTIEQRYDDKVQVVNNDIIIATTGQVGLAQRLEAVVEQVSKDRLQKPKSYADVAKAITTGALTDFQNTLTQKLELSAFAAYAVNEIPWLCEFLAGAGFQPEFKKRHALWFTTAGNHQTITDAFLGFLRDTVWKDGAPTVEEAILAAVWTLQHVCDLNTGGVKEPLHIAVLDRDPGTQKYRPRKLDETQLAEQRDLVNDAKDYLSNYREAFKAKNAPKVPEPST